MLPNPLSYFAKKDSFFCHLSLNWECYLLDIGFVQVPEAIDVLSWVGLGWISKVTP